MMEVDRLSTGEKISAVSAIEKMAGLSAHGIRLRPRALITTLVARLLPGVG